MSGCNGPSRAGSRGASCHGIVESTPDLSVEYRRKAKKIFETYYPIEISGDLSIDQKIPIMSKWCVDSFACDFRWDGRCAMVYSRNEQVHGVAQPSAS